MVQKEIVWTNGAEVERTAILSFWRERNQSDTYSIKLNNLIEQAIEIIAKHPHIGRITDFENIFSLVVHNYLIFYEVTASKIYILSIWDGRNDPEKLKGRLE